MSDRLDALRKAVDTKRDYWIAMRELELILGYDNVPDNVNDYIHDRIEGLAAGCDDPASIDEGELDIFLKDIPDDIN